MEMGTPALAQGASVQSGHRVLPVIQSQVGGLPLQQAWGREAMGAAQPAPF